MEPTQADIRRHYESFPFPSGGTLHLTQHWTRLIQDFFQEKKIIPAGQTFLDAGCGTGDNLLNFAEEFPKLIFTGIDASAHSIRIAQGKQQKLKSKNVGFSNEMILEHRTDQPYDFISCLGVLHHCQDPEKNLKHLLKMLNPGGYLLLDVYGYYGYLLTERTQHAINLLQPDFSDITRRKEAMEWIATQFLGLEIPTDPTHPRYIGLADGFLVPIAHSYRIREIILQLAEEGLSEVLWWDSPRIINGKIHYKTFRGELWQKTLPKSFEQTLLSLSQLQLYEFFELCFAPFDYFLVGQKKA